MTCPPVGRNGEKKMGGGALQRQPLCWKSDFGKPNPGSLSKEAPEGERGNWAEVGGNVSYQQNTLSSRGFIPQQRGLGSKKGIIKIKSGCLFKKSMETNARAGQRMWRKKARLSRMASTGKGNSRTGKGR